MKNDSTTSLVLAAGGLAGAYFLTRELLRTRDRQAELIADAARAHATASSAPRSELPEPASRGNAPSRRSTSREFDPIFRQHGHGLPVPYLRALAKRESDLNPSQAEGPAWGLMQVVEVVRRDYNKRFGTRHSREALLDPVINVTIATDLLNRIIAGYKRLHPDVPNLQEDWNNPRFVELLTFGWNAGFSEKAGLGRVARYLEERGITDLTIDTIHEHARAAGGVRHLQNPARVKWAKSVAALHAREQARERAAAVS